MVCYVWLYVPVHFVSGSSSFAPEPDTFYCTNWGAEEAEWYGVIECPDGSGVVPTCPNGKPCIDLYGSDEWYYASQEGELLCDVNIQEYKDDLENACWGSLKTADTGVQFDNNIDDERCDTT